MSFYWLVTTIAKFVTSRDRVFLELFNINSSSSLEPKTLVNLFVLLRNFYWLVTFETKNVTRSPQM